MGIFNNQNITNLISYIRLEGGIICIIMETKDMAADNLVVDVAVKLVLTAQ